jgi:hypothetical protein
MKRLVYIFSVVVLTLASCSSNDDNTSSPVLPTQVIETINYGGNIETSTINFIYNGSKIVRAELGSDVADYTYTDNLITKLEYKRNNEVITRHEYIYDNNERLINIKSFEFDDISGDFGSNADYVYNSNGSVSFTVYSGNLPDLIQSSSGTITLNAEGLVASVVSSTGYSYAYTYDTKNNPFKNIMGGNKLLFFNDEATNNSNRNYLSEVVSYGNSINTATYNHTYNSNDFPSQTVKTSEFETVTTQYIYNQ